jgi:membrane fusion protein (multidrug efflux system)
MLKKFLITIVVLIALVGGLAAMKISQFKTMGEAAKSAVQPPEAVTSMEVREEKWQPTLTAVGSLAAYQGVTVTTEAAGIVSEIAFEAGSRVQAGDLLVKFDVSVLEAQLQSAQARAELANLNVDRARDLFAHNTTSKAELDSTEAQFKQAQADVNATKAAIDQKIIRAPFAGQLGIRQINRGQFVDRGNPIVSLQALDPIYANFTLPQQRLEQIATGMPVQLTCDALPGVVVEGKITAINGEIESSTRNVRVQATLPNHDERLRPGMFANVAVILPNIENLLVIPSAAVLNAPYGDSVFVIEEKKDAATGVASKVVRQQFVRLGRSRGDFVVVISGLKAGQTVVTTGAFKLHNGGVVIVDNKLSPAFSLTPKPEDS